LSRPSSLCDRAPERELSFHGTRVASIRVGMSPPAMWRLFASPSMHTAVSVREPATSNEPPPMSHLQHTPRSRAHCQIRSSRPCDTCPLTPQPCDTCPHGIHALRPTLIPSSHPAHHQPMVIILRLCMKPQLCMRSQHPALHEVPALQGSSA
jgi:hypothetical protein